MANLVDGEPRWPPTLGGSAINNATHSGIILARRSAGTPGGPLNESTTRKALRHEIGHFLMDRLSQGTPEHTTDTTMIMYDHDEGKGWKFSGTDCFDMTTNGDESSAYILPL